jgi:hypothetical protein
MRTTVKDKEWENVRSKVENEGVDKGENKSGV